MCRVCLPRRALLAACALPALPARAESPGDAVVEPRLRLAGLPPGELAVAVTLDACGGGFDERIAAVLVQAAIPATIFVTELWLRRNPAALAMLMAHPTLFGLGNHGAHHLPPVLGHRPVFGLAPAGDMAAIRREVQGGAEAIEGATGLVPGWYRGATGHYSSAALPAIAALGQRIAGYSLNGDDGASLPPNAVAQRIAHARAGDVILGHINQPHRASGAGIASGLRALQQRGARFLRLDRLGPQDVEAG